MTETNAYNHLLVEKKWQNFWETHKTFSVKNGNLSEKKFYALDMFPFPSGAGLHVGHPEGYTATDIICRKKRMEGFQVLHPMGWDAFGLPAENFAIKTGVHPKKSTQKNIENFQRQIKSLGFSYDWDREFSTTDENYYKWTQYLFLKLYDKNLLYEDDKPLNWCSSCKVVCANEEVEQGLHERCGNPVTKKALKQWMFKITDYAERLLQDLEDPMLNWPEKIKAMQRNWIGKSEGITIQYPIIYTYKKNMSNTHISNDNDKNRRGTKIPKGGHLDQNKSGNNRRSSQSISIILSNIPEVKKNKMKKLHIKNIQNSQDGFVFDGFFLWKHWNGKSNCEKKYREEFALTVYKNLKNLYFISDNIGLFKNRDAIFKVFFEINNSGEKVVKTYYKDDSLSKILRKKRKNKTLTIDCYTTRPDTNFGATFVTLAPEHRLITENIETLPNSEEVKKYVAQAASKSDIERMTDDKTKTGVFTGLYVEHPATKKHLPLYVGDFVLAHVGTGAVVGVPGHDVRDFEFAKVMNLPVIRVVTGDKGEESEITEKSQVQEKSGILINSEFLNGLETKEAKEKISEYYIEKGWATKEVNYKLRDWIFTRQRYWGEPIPLVFNENGKCFALDNSQLPLVLPESANYEPSETGESPLAKIKDWVHVAGYITDEKKVIICNEAEVPAGKKYEKFTRETSTMPNWAGSSWYYLRYMDPTNSKEAWSKEAEAQWGPVDLYVGGAEHAVLHLLYARFWHKAFYDLGLVSTKEPFKKLVNQGLILSYAYQRKTGGLVPTDEVEEKLVNPETGEKKYFESATGEELEKIVAKMSKSLKNVVNPDDIVSAYGADTLRMYEMFMGPFEQNKAWDTTALEGMHKFLMKIWRLFTEKEISDACPSEELIKLTHQTVKKVSNDIDDFKFNTAISQMMIWVNAFQKLDTVPKIAGGKFVRLLSPFAPHLAEELWQKFSPTDKTISFVSWPSYQEELLIETTVSYAVQVNGKLRGDFTISKDASKEECITQAKKLEKVNKFIQEGIDAGAQIRKEIFVPGKIVGFVVK